VDSHHTANARAIACKSRKGGSQDSRRDVPYRFMQTAFRRSFARALSLGLILGATAALRAADPSFQISYAGNTTSFAAADLAALPHQEVTAFDFHEKQNHVYAGVPVQNLFEKAGIPSGEKLRGKNLRLVVVAHCSDHYDIVFALAEFDDAFNSRTILLLDSSDGKPLPEGQGPLRLVVPGDKRPARWARMVTSLEVIPSPGTEQ
jgi:hypothetical protein